MFCLEFLCFVVQKPYPLIINMGHGPGETINWPQFDSYLCIVHEVAGCQEMLIGGFFIVPQPRLRGDSLGLESCCWNGH